MMNRFREGWENLEIPDLSNDLARAEQYASGLESHISNLERDNESLRLELAETIKALEWAAWNLMFGDNKKFGELFPQFRKYVWTPDDMKG
jgi:hypothetical protein